MPMRRVLFILLLAGCVDPAEVEGGAEPVTRAWECDYELDDYAGGQPRLMVHWDIDGDRTMSGIPFNVTLKQGIGPVASFVTTTDCALFDMEGLEADYITAWEVTDRSCSWFGSAHHDYGGDFETVRLEMGGACD